MSVQKYLIVIAGPTAVGKTDVAIRIAQHLHTTIISADSRQCYKEMTIGTAKPNTEELQKVEHFFINSHHIDTPLNAADYEQLALSYADTIFQNNQYAVVCGGTGLYIKALCDGLDDMPAINETIAKNVNQQYQQNGLEWLQQEVQKHIPDFYAQAEQQNPVRLMRALTFYLCHGQSINEYKTGQKKQRHFQIIKIGLELPRPILYERINVRVDQMMAQGLEAEVKTLFPYRQLKNLQTVGYSELFDYFENKISFDEAINLIKQHTRNYAKRQLTWFKKDKEFTWFSPADYESILQYVHLKIDC